MILNVLPALKLPRSVEADPRHAAIEARLKREQKKIWERSPITVPSIQFTPALAEILEAALRFRQLAFGLEKIDQILESEKKGLAALQAKQGAAPAMRVSRILLAANDGTERFYRACERTLMNHADRTLLLLADVPSEILATKIVGQDREIKALLVSDKDAVARVLFSLA